MLAMIIAVFTDVSIWSDMWRELGLMNEVSVFMAYMKVIMITSLEEHEHWLRLNKALQNGIIWAETLVRAYKIYIMLKRSLPWSMNTDSAQRKTKLFIAPTVKYIYCHER